MIAGLIEALALEHVHLVGHSLGGDDHIIPSSQAGNLAGAKVTMIDGAGYMPMMEKVSDVNQLLGEFAL